MASGWSPLGFEDFGNTAPNKRWKQPNTTRQGELTLDDGEEPEVRYVAPDQTVETPPVGATPPKPGDLPWPFNFVKPGTFGSTYTVPSVPGLPEYGPPGMRYSTPPSSGEGVPLGNGQYVQRGGPLDPGGVRVGPSSPEFDVTIPEVPSTPEMLGFSGPGDPVGTNPRPEQTAEPAGTSEPAEPAFNPGGPISNQRIRSLIRRMGVMPDYIQDQNGNTVPNKYKKHMYDMIDAYNAQGGFQITPDMVSTINQRYMANTGGFRTPRIPTVSGINRMRNSANRQRLLDIMSDPATAMRAFRPDVPSVDINAVVAQKVKEAIEAAAENVKR